MLDLPDTRPVQAGPWHRTRLKSAAREARDARPCAPTQRATLVLCPLTRRLRLYNAPPPTAPPIQACRVYAVPLKPSLGNNRSNNVVAIGCPPSLAPPPAMQAL